jgi:hypothetical protein
VMHSQGTHRSHLAHQCADQEHWEGLHKREWGRRVCLGVAQLCSPPFVLSSTSPADNTPRRTITHTHIYVCACVHMHGRTAAALPQTEPSIPQPLLLCPPHTITRASTRGKQIRTRFWAFIPLMALAYFIVWNCDILTNQHGAVWQLRNCTVFKRTGPRVRFIGSAKALSG